MNTLLELFKIAGRIDLNGMEEAEKGLEKVDNKAGGFGSKMGSVAKTVGKYGAIIGTSMAGVGTAAFAMMTKVTSSYDDIAKGAQRLGVSTDFYQEMDYWASQNGVSHDQMERAIGRFNQRMGQATQGNAKYSNALKDLNVDIAAVEAGTLSTEDAFAQSIKSLSEMEDSNKQVALATEMFGTNLARELLPSLQDGAMGIDEAREAAQELGIVVGEDALQGAVEFQDTWDSLKRTFSAVSQQIFVQMMPAFQRIMDWVMDNMPQIQQIFESVFEVIGGIFTWVFGLIDTFIETLENWYTENEETLVNIWNVFTEYLTQVWEFVEEVWEDISEIIISVLGTIWGVIEEILTLIWEFWEDHGESIVDSVLTYFNAVWETIEHVLEAVWDIFKSILGLIVPFIQSQLEVIFQFWDEHGEMIMSAIQNAFNFIKGIIDFVMPYILTTIEYIWNHISTIFETVLGVIMGLVQFFAALFTGDWQAMGDALLNIWNSIWDGIKGVVENAWNLLSGSFKGLWNSISGWFTGLFDDALGWGKGLITGFWEGIKSMGSWLADKITGLVSKIIPGPIKKVLGINSPSKLMMEYGEYTGEGLEHGIEDKSADVEKASEQMAYDVANPIYKSAKATAGSASNIVNESTTRTGSSASGSKTTAEAIFGRGAFEGVMIMDDYSVDRLMDKIVERLNMKGVRA